MEVEVFADTSHLAVNAKKFRDSSAYRPASTQRYNPKARTDHAMINPLNVINRLAFVTETYE
jgi:hypothetical protein